jgi:hypothetical protein
MNLHKKERKQKEALGLLRRLNELYDTKYKNTELQELKDPYQHGWNRTYALREDIARSSQGPTLQRLLSLCNVSDWSKDYDFKDKRNKQWIVRPLDWLRVIWKSKLTNPTEQELKYLFDSEASTKSYNGRCLCCDELVTKSVNPGQYAWLKRRWPHYHLVIPSHYLVEKKTPRIITHVRIPDGQLESLIKQNQNKAYNTDAYYIVDHLKGHSTRDYRDTHKGKLLSKQLAKEVVQELDEQRTDL